MEQTHSSELFSLSVEPITKAHLSEAAKWARFLAIVGFIFCGLFALVGIFAGSMLSGFTRGVDAEGAPTVAGGAMVTVMYVVMAILYFFPCLYLYRFATNTKNAIQSNAQEELEFAFQNLKACFRFMGIIAIIGICFFVLAIVISVVVGVTMLG